MQKRNRILLGIGLIALAGLLLASRLHGRTAVPANKTAFVNAQSWAAHMAETRVDLNAADRVELCTLPGIGPATADRIIAYRTENGPFRSPDELLRVDGIGSATLENIREYIWVNP